MARPFRWSRALVDEMALRAAAAHPNRLAVVDARTGRGLTFSELHDRSNRFAAGLAERGVGRGDVVAPVAAGGPDDAQALYGALAGGAAVASANPADWRHRRPRRPGGQTLAASPLCWQ